MKTLSEIRFEKVIKEGFQDILKPLGFKKKGSNFYLQLNDLGQIINIQKSVWGTKDSISFTINIGLFLSEHWKGLLHNQGKTLPIFPAEVDCLIRKRIGYLRNEGDTWYNIFEESDEHQLVTQMQINLRAYVLPYFNKTKTKQELLNLLETEKLIVAPLSKLITYGELQLFEKARTEYETILKDKSDPYFLETVKAYASKYGFE